MESWLHHLEVRRFFSLLGSQLHFYLKLHFVLILSPFYGLFVVCYIVAANCRDCQLTEGWNEIATAKLINSQNTLRSLKTGLHLDKWKLQSSHLWDLYFNTHFRDLGIFLIIETVGIVHNCWKKFIHLQKMSRRKWITGIIKPHKTTYSYYFNLYFLHRNYLLYTHYYPF